MGMRSIAIQRQLLRKLQRVVRRWPEDPSRRGRDLGEFLRGTYMSHFKEQCMTDPAKAAASLDSLERLNTNYYYQKYPREKNLAFTGDILVNNPWLLSNDNLQQMQQKSRSFWEKVTGRRKPSLGERHS